jgi:glycerol uptake facilitator-like aquaporin
MKKRAFSNAKDLMGMSKIPCAQCKMECFSELVGTFILVLIGLAAVIISSLVPSLVGIEALVFIALAFRGTVALLIHFLGRYSGPVINPALTIAVAAAKMLKKELLILYPFFRF